MLFDFGADVTVTVNGFPSAPVAAVYVSVPDGHDSIPETLPLSWVGSVPRQYDPAGQSVHVVPVPV